MANIVVPCVECGAKSRIPDAKQHLGPKCGKCKSTLGVQEYVIPVELSDSTMDTFIKAEKLPVLVDFFSPTCGPCGTLAPVLQKLTEKYFKQLVVCTVNTSQNPGCSAYYKIKGVPSLIFFKEGRVIDQIEGLPDVSLLDSKMGYYASR